MQGLGVHKLGYVPVLVCRGRCTLNARTDGGSSYWCVYFGVLNLLTVCTRSTHSTIIRISYIVYRTVCLMAIPNSKLRHLLHRPAGDIDIDFSPHSILGLPPPTHHGPRGDLLDVGPHILSPQTVPPTRSRARSLASRTLDIPPSVHPRRSPEPRDQHRQYRHRHVPCTFLPLRIIPPTPTGLSGPWMLPASR